MEHHHAAAADHHELSLDIHLLYQPLGVVNAVARRVCEDRMEVDTGCITLQRLSEVQITFPHRHENVTTYHRIMAHVSHHRAGQATLRFIRCSRDAHRALQALLAH